MKLVTHFEAATRSTAELRALLSMAFAAAASASPCSQARRDALTSIRTIEIELARRPPCL
ncbi:hypothetical protein [Pelagibacterium montanilacus]|uniref:hypothetical protein n=1 Tax=Pelagibacterium montanilacus TaxID=2185280 RepID=UPI000F8DD3AF|nr:hypothetical protein [Pelagibacterium montanilacus]